MATGNPGNPQPQPPTPDPKDLKLIEDYLRKSGLNAAELSRRMNDVRNSSAEFNRELDNAERHFASLNTAFDDLRTTIKNAADDLTRTNSTVSRINKSYKSLASISDQLAYDAREIHTLSAKQLESSEKKLLKEIDNLRLRKQELDNLGYAQHTRQELLAISRLENTELAKEATQYLELQALFEENGELRNEENNYIKKLLDLTRIRLDEEKKINKTLGLSGKFVDGIVGSLEKLGIRSEFFENLKEDMRDAAKSGNMWKVLGTGLSGVFKGLKDALKDPLFIITSIYKIFKSIVGLALSYQKAVFEASKSLGLNVIQSEKLANNFNTMAAANTKMALTSTQMIKTYQELSDSLGVMTNQSEEFMTTSSTLMRNLGLSAQHMESMQMFALNTNRSVKQTFALIQGTAKAEGARLKIAMTEKQVMDGISKVSATVFNNFKGNVVELSKAVVQATKFGTTLDQINQAGMSMLDFQSSISKEFEAQLLTGKQLDLTMARQYALSGDTNKLMGEITRQLGDQDGWNKMNVLKQQSLAEALGMSKEAVDEMFRKQKMISILGEDAGKTQAEQYEALKKRNMTHAEIVKVMGEEAANGALQASAQDKMTAAVERMSFAFGAIADAFLPITSVVNGVAKLMDKITGSSKTLVKILSVILGYYVGIKAAQGVIFLLEQRKAMVMAAQKAGELLSMRRATFTAIAKAMSFGGPAGLILAGVVAAALAGYAASLGVEAVGSSVGASSGASSISTSMESSTSPTPGSAASIKPIKMAEPTPTGAPENSIKPVNALAANASVANNQAAKTTNQPQSQPVINVMLETKVDPLNRNKVEMVVAKGTTMDSSTGQNANVKVNAIGKV